LEFWGRGDEYFGWQLLEDGAVAHDDHDDCAALSVRAYHVACGGQRLAVTGVYGRGCMWSVGIGPIDDDEPMPDWEMQWRFRDYTAVLSIVLPDDTLVITLAHDGERDCHRLQLTRPA
jgi:hypothetical protein